MITAIHQPNFIPWFPFFEKIAVADTFVVLTQCQFEKNAFQNRCKIGNDWLTNPVHKGLQKITHKKYTNGESLVDTNLTWIYAICMTLDIDTDKIILDGPTDAKGTQRIIDICKETKADAYLSNPEAFDKYLEADKFFDAHIKIVPFKSMYKKPIFEMLTEHGIYGCREILKKTVSRHKDLVGGLVRI